MGVEIQDDAVAQDGRRHGVDIFDRQVQAALQESADASAFDQRLRSARRAAIADELARQLMPDAFFGLRGHHQVDGVFLHVRRNQHLVADVAQAQDLRAVEHRAHDGFIRLNGAIDDGAEVAARRIGHQDLHQEAVELGFRQRIGAFHLDGILRGHHQKRRFQKMRGGSAGDGVLLHGFKQGALRLGRGAIDFVGQDQVGENRAGLEAQRLCAALRCR